MDASQVCMSAPMGATTSPVSSQTGTLSAQALIWQPPALRSRSFETALVWKKVGNARMRHPIEPSPVVGSPPSLSDTPAALLRSRRKPSKDFRPSIDPGPIFAIEEDTVPPVRIRGTLGRMMRAGEETSRTSSSPKSVASPLSARRSSVSPTLNLPGAYAPLCDPEALEKRRRANKFAPRDTSPYPKGKVRLLSEPFQARRSDPGDIKPLDPSPDAPDDPYPRERGMTLTRAATVVVTETTKPVGEVLRGCIPIDFFIVYIDNKLHQLDRVKKRVKKFFGRRKSATKQGTADAEWEEEVLTSQAYARRRASSSPPTISPSTISPSSSQRTWIRLPSSPPRLQTKKALPYPSRPRGSSLESSSSSENPSSVSSSLRSSVGQSLPTVQEMDESEDGEEDDEDGVFLDEFENAFRGGWIQRARIVAEALVHSTTYKWRIYTTSLTPSIADSLSSQTLAILLTWDMRWPGEQRRLERIRVFEVEWRRELKRMEAKNTPNAPNSFTELSWNGGYHDHTAGLIIPNNLEQGLSATTVAAGAADLESPAIISVNADTFAYLELTRVETPKHRTGALDLDPPVWQRHRVRRWKQALNWIRTIIKIRQGSRFSGPSTQGDAK
ncbi:hypothetical protein P154DRAFT_571340 [Amniculicola lignicola CBS 123094]|uniref:Uncharacterized protein n=1 Tax=Amniculicola lignicola CBS 123094 TaxID=1392246 RepID=A0A6A5X298_9PLEO|nr:hypothetical protein P154DRAFT_571340 [Amniculicola lignicola CBS 123094]